MPITASAITADIPEPGGRRWVTEAHTLASGSVQVVRYLAERGADADAAMRSRVADIDAGLVRAEVDTNIAAVLALGAQALPALTFVESTQAQTIAAFADLVPSLAPLDRLQLGAFLASWHDENLALYLGLSTGQAATLRDVVASAHAALASVAAVVDPIAQAVA